MSTRSVRDAALQLESVLLRQMLRDSGVGRTSEGSGSHVVTDLFVDALAGAIGRSGGLGLASVLERSLSQPGGAPTAPTAPTAPAMLTAATATAATAATAAATSSAEAVPPAPPSVLEDLVLAAGARVTSGFGPRRDPLTGAARAHAGVDIGAPEGSPVRAVRGGEIVFAGEAEGYGLLVEIDHGNGVRSRYAHASKLHVCVGARIEPGSHVADVGSTGRSTGAHLHFEVRVHGRSVDPAFLLQDRVERDEAPWGAKP